MRVLCIDPGPHVGGATWDTVKHDAWEWTPEQFYTQVEGWVVASEVVVAEDYRIGGSRGREANVTIEMLGVLRYLCRVHSKQFILQAPGAYKFAGSDKLKRLGWYTVGSDHARSASGHLVLYLVTAGLLDPAQLVP